MRILLVGGAGFIGSWLTKELTNRGHKVHIVDPVICSTPYQFKDQVVKFRYDELLRDADVTKEDFLKVGEDIVGKFDPDLMMHLGARPLEKDFESDISRKQLTNDMELTYEAIKLSRQFGVDRFIFMSSLFAYGDHEYAATETYPLNPRTIYGTVKASGEHLVREFTNNWNIIRTTSVYGFGDLNNRVTQILINKARAEERFWINQDAWLDFIYIKDLARGIADVIDSRQLNEAFHISGGKALTLFDYVETLKKHYPKMDYTLEDPKDRPKRGTLDNSKARMLLKWEPEYDLQKGVDDYMIYVSQYGFA